VKIADVCEFYSPTGGGVRNYVHQKLEHAARLGHDLTIVAPGAHTAIEECQGGRIAWVKSPYLPFDRNYRMFWSAAEVWRVLDGLAPDVVEGSSPWRGGWIAARWPGAAARVLFMHADPVAVYPQTFLGGALGTERVDRMFGWFWTYLKRLNASFDGTVVAGQWLAERFARHGMTNLHVVPFGVDAAHFGPERRDAAVRAAMLEKCGLGPDAAILINVGRHHPEKRIELLIDAVTHAQKTRPVGLYIVGDGLSHARVRSRAARARHVHVAGRIVNRTELSQLMASADALFHGSAAETFGFVVAEALCSATPVIVPDAGGAGELAGPAYAEVFVSGDADSAAQAVLRLLARDRTCLSRAALEAGRRRVGDTANHFDNLFRLYAELADGRRAAAGDALRVSAGKRAGKRMIDTHAVTARSTIESFFSRDVVVLSPHLDDACFSLGGFLTAVGRGVLINIFTRSTFLVRPPSPPLSEQVVSDIRKREDIAFAKRSGLVRHDMGIAEPPIEGREPFDLSHLETDVARITAPLLAKLDEVANSSEVRGRRVLFCPMGIGRHVNHCATLEVILRNFERVLAGYELMFYEDQPYAAHPFRRSAGIARLKQRLGELPLLRNVYVPKWKEKKALIALYPSQRSHPILRWSFRPAAPGPLAPHEAFWSVDWPGRN
jgi:alpha-1,6-mannosyltransferase